MKSLETFFIVGAAFTSVIAIGCYWGASEKIDRMRIDQEEYSESLSLFKHELKLVRGDLRALVNSSASPQYSREEAGDRKAELREIKEKVSYLDLLRHEEEARKQVEEARLRDQRLLDRVQGR